MLFQLFYLLALEEEQNHVFKRWYLLLSGLLSLCIPLFTFTKIEYVLAEAIPQKPLVVLENELVPEAVSDGPLNLGAILWIFYGIGVAFSGWRLGKQLWTLRYTIKHNAKEFLPRSIRVLLEKDISPSSFLRYLFVSKKAYQSASISKEILLHEEAHIQQKHSWDILAIAILKIVFWFNPLWYWLQKTIKRNHEYLADKAVLEQTQNPQAYAMLLLQHTAANHQSELCSNFHYSLIKKRIVMMHSKNRIWIRRCKTFLVVPLTLTCVWLFSNEVVAQKVQPQNPATKKTHGPNAISEVEEAFLFQNVKVKVTNPDGTKTTYTYPNIPESAKKLWLQSNLKPTKENKPTAKLLQTWRNTKVYGLWIDGTRIDNAKLINYQASDFGKYTSSPLLKNAKDYGLYQYQIDLYTHAYQQIQKEKQAQAYEAFKKQYQQKGVSRDEMKEYTGFVNAFYKKLEKERTIKTKDFERMTYIYNRMSDKQKASVKKMPPPPPPSPKGIEMEFEKNNIYPKQAKIKHAVREELEEANKLKLTYTEASKNRQTFIKHEGEGEVVEVSDIREVPDAIEIETLEVMKTKNGLVTIIRGNALYQRKKQFYNRFGTEIRDHSSIMVWSATQKGYTFLRKGSKSRWRAKVSYRLKNADQFRIDKKGKVFWQTTHAKGDNPPPPPPKKN